MRWNLRWVAANADIWRPSDLLVACRAVGYSPSLSKVSSWWHTTPTSVRLADLDMICTALRCRVDDLLEAEPPTSAPTATAGEAEPASPPDGTPQAAGAPPEPDRA